MLLAKYGDLKVVQFLIKWKEGYWSAKEVDNFINGNYC